jgi:uncharacterized protein YidB (DUF937 family)
MQRGPLTALLAVLAVAGYQNRDKIAEVLRNLGQGGNVPNSDGTMTQTGGLGDLLGRISNGGLGSMLGGSSPGGILSGGLGGLLDQFKQNGLGDRADSWVRPGPNESIEDQELSQALGPEVLEELAAKTGLPRDEILARLSRDLPKAVDDLTPDGTVPTAAQLDEMTGRIPSPGSVPNVSRNLA